MNAEGAASKTEERSSPRLECCRSNFRRSDSFSVERFQERRFRFSNGLGLPPTSEGHLILAARSGPAPTI